MLFFSDFGHSVRCFSQYDAVGNLSFRIRANVETTDSDQLDKLVFPFQRYLLIRFTISRHGAARTVLFLVPCSMWNLMLGSRFRLDLFRLPSSLLLDFLVFVLIFLLLRFWCAFGMYYIQFNISPFTELTTLIGN